MTELEEGLSLVRAAPKDTGVLELIVRRPGVGQREVLEEGRLDLVEGLVGDNWRLRQSPRTSDGSPHPDMQLNVISSRAVNLVAGDRERWQLAGDQLVIDMEMSQGNLSPGTRLAIGSAIIAVTDQPHTGCYKFSARFGVDALAFVNSELGRQLQLRGLCAKVVQAGAIHVGDIVRKVR
jgi:hypothetical protein